MSSSKCCFLILHKDFSGGRSGGLVFHLFQNFPQFILIHTVKGFGIVNKAEIDVFLELSCFFDDPVDVSNLTSGSPAFLKPVWTSGSWQFTYCWSLAWRILSITLLSCEVKVKVKVKSLSRVRLFATPWTVSHQSPLSTGILKARILEWVAISFSRGSSRTRDRTCVSCLGGGCFTIWATREAPMSC